MVTGAKKLPSVIDTAAESSPAMSLTPWSKTVPIRNCFQIQVPVPVTGLQYPQFSKIGRKIWLTIPLK